MKLFITVALVLVCAVAWIFFDRFTRRGAIPLEKAVRDFTSYLCAMGVVLGDYIIDLLRWVADFWEPMRAQFGDLLHAPNAGLALQLLSLVFFLFKAKGQGRPKLKLPDLPK